MARIGTSALDWNSFCKRISRKMENSSHAGKSHGGTYFICFWKIKGKFTIPKIDFPVLSLLVSGGHTELIFSKSWLEYKIIGQTLDDAAGEAFDKVARMMELPYPGGPQISKLAEEQREKKNNFLGVSRRPTGREAALRARGDSDPKS